jgi:translocation and assembly module TamB
LTKPRRALRRVFGFLLLALLSVVAAAPFALRLPAVRRIVVERVNGALSSTFAGRVAVDRIGALGLTYVDGLEAHVDDAEGHRLLRIEGGHARASTWALVRSLLGRQGAIEIDLPELSLARVDATVDADDGGEIRIAGAFALRPRPPPSGPSRAVHVTLPRIEIALATLHLRPTGGPLLDAEFAGAQASVLVAPGVLAVDLDRGPLTVRGLPGGLQAQGRIEAHLSQAPLRVQAIWSGAVGTLGGRADVTYRDGRIDAALDLSPATPDQMRVVWPECPLTAVCEAHAEAHGVLPRIDVSSRALIGSGAIEIAGPVVVGPNVQASLHVDAKGLDAGALARQLPPLSEIVASGDVSVLAKPTGIEARGALEFAGGTLGSTKLPAASLAGEFARSAAGEPSGRLVLTVRQASAPTVLVARLVANGGPPRVAFEGKTTIARLQDFMPAALAVTGSVDAHATGQVDVTARTIDARLYATVANVAVRGTSIRSARIEAHAAGRLDAPSVDLAIDGEGLEAGEVRLSAARAQGVLTPGPSTTVRDIHLEIAGDAEPASARAALVRISGDGLQVDDGVVEGLGAPLNVTLRTSPSGVVVQARSEGLDLARLDSFAAIPIKRGIVRLDVDATVRAGSARGRLAMNLRHAAFAGVDDASAEVDAVLDGRHAAGHATARVEDIGTLELHSSTIDVGSGPLLTASPWRRTWGAVQFDAHLDLARLAAKIPRARLPIDEVTGTLQIKGQASRDSADDATPGVEVTIEASRLALAGKRADGSGTWRIDGIDPTVHATVDGNTGRTILQAQLHNGGGAIATLEGQSSEVPYAILFSSDESLLDALARMPFEAHLVVPKVKLDSLPAFFRAGVGGAIEASASWHGALTGPHIDLAAAATGVRPDPALFARKLDLSLAAHYDGAQADASLQAIERGHKVLDAIARLTAAPSDVLAGFRGSSVPWSASAQAKLDRLPLQSISPLDDRQVRGTVSGTVTLDGLHEDARARAALSFDHLEIGGVTCRSSSVDVTVDGRTLEASVRLDQDDGFAMGHARFGSRWGRANTPTLDPSQAAQASMAAHQFRAAFLLPFVSKWLTELDGRIDADAQVDIDAGTSAVRPRGTIALKDGTFELTSFGGQFHQATGEIAFAPGGIVRLENAEARGLSGRVQAAASARLDGASLVGARATALIPAKDPLPLVFDGVQMGMLDGRFELAMNRKGAGRATELDVDVGTAHLQLPAGPSSRDLQALGDIDGVRVGVGRGPAAFHEVPLVGSRSDATDPTGAPRTPLQVSVHLADVQVSRGTDLDVRLEGQQTIAIADETRVSGQVRMTRGSIDVYGKPFALDRGTVSFVGTDPTNPQIVLTASWQAPDGITRVYADFVGPLKTGKVRLRSEPSKPQSEILSLVLFGTEDQATSSPSGTPTQVSPAAAAAGGAATQPINKALSGVDRALENLGLGGGIMTKIDTSKINVRPEVEVQIARDISLQVAWVLGVPPPANPDSTLVTLDWHFLRKWSLETTVGDAGTSILDLVWQHRY